MEYQYYGFKFRIHQTKDGFSLILNNQTMFAGFACEDDAYEHAVNTIDAILSSL